MVCRQRLACDRFDASDASVRLPLRSCLCADAKLRCNPYHRLGHLHVNTSVPAENRWEPFDSSKCTPEDYLSAIVSPASSVPVNLDFARNKTILLIGDSVDRDHNLHFCIAVKGIVEVITAGYVTSL